MRVLSVAITAAVLQCAVSQDIVSSCAGGFHTCSVLSDGKVKCWGSNEFGQLGLGDTLNRGNHSDTLGNRLPAVLLGPDNKAASVSCSLGHTCALLHDGNIKCWGSNDFGQLGTADTLNRGDGAGEMGDALPPVRLGSGRTVLSVSAGQFHTCAVLDNGSIKCWGNNGFGQLGMGDQLDRGGERAEMGDNLPAVQLGAGRTAVSVACGAWHTCAILDTGSVKCWGGNHHGQLGVGDTAHRGNSAGEMGDALPVVGLGSNLSATSLTCGYWHTCSLLDDGAAKCWGYNGDWQLGIVEAARRGDEVGEMGDALPAIDLGGGRRAANLTCGSRHTCAVLDDGGIKCWGYNVYGMLGYGDTLPRGGDSGLLPDSIPAIDLGRGPAPVALSLGYWHSCALRADGTAKCWGFNDRGQLGLGDDLTRGDVGGQMGDSLPAAWVGCRTGFMLPDTGAPSVICLDENECTRGVDDCEINSQCLNAEGSFTCLCKAGFAHQPHPDGSSNLPQCVPCALNQFKSSVGNDAPCMPCPAGSQTLAPASAACTCAAGFYNSTSAPQGCELCLIGFFCRGDAHIEACPDFSNSTAGSDAIEDCTCIDGYEEEADGQCVEATSKVAVIVGSSVGAVVALCLLLALAAYCNRPRAAKVETEADRQREAEAARKGLEEERRRKKEEEERAKQRDAELKVLQEMESKDAPSLTICEHGRAAKFCKDCRSSSSAYLSSKAILSAEPGFQSVTNRQPAGSTEDVLFVRSTSRLRPEANASDSAGGNTLPAEVRQPPARQGSRKMVDNGVRSSSSRSFKK